MVGSRKKRSEAGESSCNNEGDFKNWQEGSNLMQGHLRKTKYRRHLIKGTYYSSALLENV